MEIVQGIILKTSPYSETQKIIRIYTKEKGYLSMISPSVVFLSLIHIYVRVRCVAADSIYANNANRKFCTKYGISTSFVRKGRAVSYTHLWYISPPGKLRAPGNPP